VKLTLGKEAAKFTFPQVSHAIMTFISDFSPLQRERLLRELDRIAHWLSAVPFEFVGSSILVAHDSHPDGDCMRVKLIDFGHVEEVTQDGAANVGCVLGIRTLQRIVQQFTQSPSSNQES
jgi:hypothetical protein